MTIYQTHIRLRNALALEPLETNTSCQTESRTVVVEKERQSIKEMHVHTSTLYFMLCQKHLVWDLGSSKRDLHLPCLYEIL